MACRCVYESVWVGETAYGWVWSWGAGRVSWWGVGVWRVRATCAHEGGWGGDPG